MTKKICVFGLLILSAVLCMSLSSTTVQAEDPPADRVAVMYFHRTQRCPTCQRMGGFSEEAVTTGFSEEMEGKTVTYNSVDFQAAGNARFVSAYKITGPALIIAQVQDGKVTKWANLTEIWAKAADKEAFIGYVQTNVRSYME